MEKRYAISAVGADINVKRDEDSGLIEFYGKGGFVATFEPSSGVFEKKADALVNVRDLALAEMLCSFAVLFVSDRQKATDVKNGIPNKPQRNESKNDYSR
ncbi:MAG: hypothetical protein LUD29_04025 [Clostridia bacterium]|nr:hypothetical protein [Clostridia bacterium]